MAEEYNLETNILIRRAWKHGNNVSKKSKWEIELGDPEPDSSFDNIGIKENTNSVSLTSVYVHDTFQTGAYMFIIYKAS